MKGVNFINVFSKVFVEKTTSLTLYVLFPLIISSCGNTPLKTGYIDINQVNREFKLAISYDKYIKNLEKEANIKLSSFKNEINLMEKNVLSDEGQNKKDSKIFFQALKRKKEIYFLEEKKFKKNILDSIKIYRDKLNVQINELIYKYALENAFDYVYSPAGTGTFMYADSNLNITKDVIYYLNSRQLDL